MQHMHHDIRGEHDRQGHKQQGWGRGDPPHSHMIALLCMMYLICRVTSSVAEVAATRVYFLLFVCLCLRGDFDFDFDMKLKTDRVL